MITIRISPLNGMRPGWYRATGHAGDKFPHVCTAVTAIEECLAANLARVFDLRVTRTVSKGSYALTWEKKRQTAQESIRRANDCAGFVYNGLAALQKQYPAALRVKWMNPFVKGGEIEEEEETE